MTRTPDLRQSVIRIASFCIMWLFVQRRVEVPRGSLTYKCFCYMKKRINDLHLCEKLTGCPKETKLWSPLFGECEFIGLSNDLDEDPEDDKFWVRTDELGLVTFFDDGRFFAASEECLIFPSKDNRDWSKFKVHIERFDPKTFQPFDKVLVRDFTDEEWLAAFFGYIDLTKEFPCKNIGVSSSYCIPYNDETKNLLGTKDDCPEYYKWWKNE